MEQKDLWKEKGKWERLSVAIKMIAVLACSISFLLGKITALDLRGAICLCSLPLFLLDLYCVYKQNKLKADDDAKPIGALVFSAVWFVILFAVCFFIACILQN